MQDTPDTRTLSKLALWALICGIAALFTNITVIALMASPHGFPIGLLILCVLGFMIAAIILGHTGIPKSTRSRGKKGMAMAIIGMIMGYAQLPLLILAVIAVPQYTGVQEYERFQVQEGGIAAAMATCDLTLGEALMSGEEFSCADAQHNFVPPEGLTVTIETNGPNSCLLTATAHGSGTPTTEVWSYQQ